MANAVTLSRLVLLLIVILLLYQEPGPAHNVAFGMLILLFTSDALDGYLARKFHKESLVGAMLDIAGDRIVELSLWIVYADLQLTPIWVPLVFVVRGVAVDTIRGIQAGGKGVAPFNLAESVPAQVLVAGRFVRGLYGTAKATAFCSLALLIGLPATLPQFWHSTANFWTVLAYVSVYASVVLCLVRGAPVIVEFGLAAHAAAREAPRSHERGPV